MSGFASTNLHVAAKPHKCGECYRTITAGETYQRFAGVWEGEFWAMKGCAHCAAFREIILDHDPDFWEGCYGGIDSWVSDGASDDLIGYGPWPWARRMRLFRLRHQYRNHWRDNHGDLLPIPDPSELVLDLSRCSASLRQIIERFFATAESDQLPGQLSIYDELEAS